MCRSARTTSLFRKSFPQFAEPIVAVIRADIAERAEQAAQALAESLKSDAKHFTAVAYPEGEPFLIRHALLYLQIDELARLVDRLSAAQPLLATLAGDPTLRGIAQFVSLVLNEAPENGALQPEFDQLLGAFAAVAQALGATVDSIPSSILRISGKRVLILF